MSQDKTLKWLDSLLFLCYKKRLFWKSNNVNDVNIFLYFHQFFHLVFFAQSYKNEILLIHPQVFIIF